MKLLLTVVVIGIFVLGGSWYWSSMQATVPSPNENASASLPVTKESVAPAVAMPTPTPAPVPVVFTVIGKNFSFTPATLKVKKGDTVSITFKNESGTHDFKIDELGIATKRLATGEQEIVTFVADKVGSFQYYCSIGKHRAMGMKGVLTVTE